MPDEPHGHGTLTLKGSTAESRPASTPTLLPSSLASVVSLVTRSSSLSLRLGTFVGGLAITGAKAGTLTGIELSRTVVGLIISRAGNDVVAISRPGLAEVEAESLVEKSLAYLHSTLTHFSFLASTGFAVSSYSLETASELSQHFLAALDAILGSTESSKAIAAIVTLIRREFRPKYGDHTETIGVTDLLVATCGVALLQRWCSVQDLSAREESKSEEVVWDIVKLNGGSIADVIPSHKRSPPLVSEDDTFGKLRRASFVSTGQYRDTFEAIQRDVASTQFPHADAEGSNLRQEIMRRIPDGAKVDVTVETLTRKTITIEVTGCDSPDLSPLEGLSMIEEHSHPSRPGDDDSSSYYRVVYTTDVEKRSDKGKDGVSLSIEAPDILEESQLYPATNHISGLEIKYPPSSDTPKPSIEGSPINRKHDNDKIETANIKRSRQPLASPAVTEDSAPESSPLKQSPPKRAKNGKTLSKADKKSTFKRALTKGASGANLSSLWTKDTPLQSKVAKPSENASENTNQRSSDSSRLPVPIKRDVSVRSGPDAAAQQRVPPSLASRDPTLGSEPRTSSRLSFHKSRLETQTDSYSMYSAESTRSSSPTHLRGNGQGQSSLIRTKSGRQIVSSGLVPSSPRRSLERPISIVPSIHTLQTRKSQESFLALVRGNSQSEPIRSLLANGRMLGQFPFQSFVKSSCRFMKFASAAYGQFFLNMMGLATKESKQSGKDEAHHVEHHSFSNHIRLPPSTILLSSFVDPSGLPQIDGTSNNALPLVHFVILDHASKAVVLTCRGTLGFEDVLTDLACDYEGLVWRGKTYQVHRGILASARRLLYGPSSRVVATLKVALEEFPEYGLVLCGHSLGGGVASVLAILLSEPDPSCATGSFFVTASPSSPEQATITDGSEVGTSSPEPVHLPSHRPIHVYAYGPSAVVSPSLQRATSALITTIINDQDCVPYLSLGILQDLQEAALAFKTDTTGAKKQVRDRVWSSLTGGVLPSQLQGSNFFFTTAPTNKENDEDLWAYAALKNLRSCMQADKLVPPGEVFVVKTQEVLQRESFTARGERILGQASGRPATRVTCRYVRDVEKVFAEIRFGMSMLGDHSPGRYEASLEALAKAVGDD